MSTFVFTMTCPYVGECYDITLDGEDLGWVRLRHSQFVARNTEGKALLTVEFDEFADPGYSPWSMPQGMV